MICGKRVLSLVPARRGSKGLPLKNIRPLLGRALLCWPVAAALSSRYVDRVVVSTDDAEFAAIAVAAGAEAPFLRPPELSTDTAPSSAYILHALEFLARNDDPYDFVVLLEPTSPLTEGSDVDAALEVLVAQAANADAIVGVAELTAAHPAFAVRIGPSGLLSPYLSNGFASLPRRQDIEPLYCLDGSLYISTVEAFRREHSFCHARTLPYVMPRYKSFEVDDLVDFLCIEALLKNRALLADPVARA